MENYVVSQSKLLFKKLFLNSSFFSGVFRKRSLDNVSLDWSAKVTSSCDWSVIATLLSDKTEAGRQDYKNIFPRTKFTRQSNTGLA